MIQRFYLILLFVFVDFSAWAGHYFDDHGYELSPSFKTPMDTIAGLSDWTQNINYVYGIVTIVLAFVFLTVSIPLIIVIFKFRATEEEVKTLPPPKQVHGNAVLEFAWTIIPVFLLILIAVPTWEIIFKQPTKPPPGAFRVDVIGNQWWWAFKYPDLGITTANELHLPENTPVFFTLASNDVIHSFWVPKLGGKVDAFPGKDVPNHMFFTTPSVQDYSKKGGDYYQGQCAELCGLSHALMRFEVVVHTKAEFDRWVAAYHKPPIVETELEKKGEMLFAQCSACHTISGTPSEDIEKQLASMTPPVSKIGPNLTDFGSRRTLGAGTRANTFENFFNWVDNPEKMKPGSKMTKLGLAKEDIEAIAAYVRHSTAKTF